ncbi:MAG: histidine phosphatase family protein [Elusimicrobia bacterium]|nr:histidine phosphatase family protein [Elusimicrobiota bacterium]
MSAQGPSLLVIVRHAESQRNEAKKDHIHFPDEAARAKVKGIPDHHIPLTPEGWRQSEAVGRLLRQQFGRFDGVYHSGYLRTIQTTEGILSAYPAAERRRMAVRAHVFIRERDSGYTYDMTTAEVEDAFPWITEYWDTFGGFFARPVGGESLAQVVERVHLFLNILARDHAGQKVLIVTHVGTLRCFRFLLEQWSYDQALAWLPGTKPGNCGIAVYVTDRSTHRLRLRDYTPTVFAAESRPDSAAPHSLRDSVNGAPTPARLSRHEC